MRDDNDNRTIREHWSGGEWFALPLAWMPAVNELRLNELRVLLWLARYAKFDEGTTYPGNDRIAEDLRKRDGKRPDEKVIRGALKALQDKGFIQKIEEGGGRGRATVYRLKTPAKNTGVNCFQTPVSKTPVHNTPVAEKNPGKSLKETPVSVAQNPGKQTQKPRYTIPPQQRDQREQRSNNKAIAASAAAAGADGCAGGEGDRQAAVRAALQARGITGPKLDSLAALPWLTPATVEYLAERVSARTADNPAGLLVRLIESDGQDVADKFASGELVYGKTPAERAEQDRRRRVRELIAGANDIDNRKHERKRA